MHRVLSLTVVLTGLAVLTACVSAIPESSLTLRNATTNQLVSTSQTTGTVTLSVGEVYPLIIIRTYRNENGSTDNQDVTQFVKFLWGGPQDVAAIDPFGNITGLAPGVALLEVRFRESVLEPRDIVRLTVYVSPSA